MVSKSDEYAQALDELDRLRDGGQLTANEYEVKRARLLREAAKTPPGLGARLLIALGFIVGGIIVLRIVLVILSAFVGG